jgi:adenylosuccinate synthase
MSATYFVDPRDRKRSLMLRQKPLCSGAQTGFKCKHYWSTITKLDVLTGFDEIKVCVAYKTPFGETDDFPIDQLDKAEPIYRSMTGWTEDLRATRLIEDLPRAARDYVRLIEDAAGCGASIVSVGYRRDETIVRVDPFV